MSMLSIRPATAADIPAITRIYGHAVRHGTASFELETPDEAEMMRRMRALRDAGYPYLVAETDAVAGYAYATQFRDRAAYQFTAEDSIYVHPDWMGRGIGRALLDTLMQRSSAQGFRTIIAVIGGAEPASIALHSKCGFREAGRLEKVGFKFGRWLDSLYMQRELSGV